MDQAQIALSILTIAASGVVAGVVTFKLSASRDSRRLRREKLEALFAAHRGFLRQLDTAWLPYMHAMDGEIDYNTALRLSKAQADSQVYHFETAEMLVGLYFPELDRDFAQLVSIRDRAADVILAHKNEYKRLGPHKSKAIIEMQALVKELDAHQMAFQQRLRAVAKRLGAHSSDAA